MKLSPQALDLLRAAAQPGGVTPPPFGDPRRFVLTHNGLVVLRRVLEVTGFEERLLVTAAGREVLVQVDRRVA